MFLLIILLFGLGTQNGKKKRVENVSQHEKKASTTNNEGLHQYWYNKQDQRTGIVQTQCILDSAGNHYDADVEELYLEHQNLKSMTCFEKLPNIRKLILSGNKISVLEGLDRCILLEELILEDNCIKQVNEIMSFYKHL